MKIHTEQINASRRTLIKQTLVFSSIAPFVTFGSVNAMIGSIQGPNDPIFQNYIGFNGERKDPVTGAYHLGNGYRVYNPRLMRFQSCDSLSPFEQGGINSYAYCFNDPINRRDPSGHIAFLSLLIGAIIGSVVGFVVSLTSEAINASLNGTSIDWAQVGIGTALGFISGGFGAAAQGTSFSVKLGLSIAEAVASGGVEFGLNVASGKSVHEAGQSAFVGVAIGFAGFGVGSAGSRAFSHAKHQMNSITSLVHRFDDGRIGIPMSPQKAPQSAPSTPTGIGAQASMFVRTIQRSMSSGNMHIERAIEPRTFIEQNLARSHSESSFANALYGVNRNLSSHGDTNISVEASRAYVRDAQRTMTGELSNTAAHFNAAARWLRRGDGVGMAGFLFNFAGGVSSGVIDHARHRTGRLLSIPDDID
ncbi:RHS repeat-associated core domain-containing protein [Vibrio scophthalmi]|uniref:RHS repeat-associated core domain-containing protein n=1 Tax=Vibrio scophthalmi TaxID=45658 RepID=A0A1E3WLF4_9VIBR|nr:RHS repeat-associated core domain-containing protein [Vibrio scophthalmi]ODS10596.1 hypothetical protein VSF3289_00855 [Vibrio scophthalmi]